MLTLMIYLWSQLHCGCETSGYCLRNVELKNLGLSDLWADIIPLGSMG